MNTATTSPVLAKEPFLRAAGVCGLLILVTVSVDYIGGALAQPDAYSDWRRADAARARTR
jgi:hypothetical protein